MAIAQLIEEATAEVQEVKRWIDNDIEAGDEAITIHQQSLERGLAKLEEAKERLEALEAAL